MLDRLIRGRQAFLAGNIYVQADKRRAGGNRQTGWQEAGRLAGGRQNGMRQTTSRRSTGWQEDDRLAGGRQAGMMQTTGRR